MNAFWALLVVAVTLQGCESTPITIDPTPQYVSKTAAMLDLVASDNNAWKATSVSITEPAGTTATLFSTAIITATPTQSLGMYGLSPGTKYVVTVEAAKSGTAADEATTPVDPLITVCTEADALAGLEVDSAGTTAEAIKIKWTAVTSATYRVYLDTKLIKDGLTAVDFTFDDTTLDGKGVTLDSVTANSCKVEAVVATPGCTNDEIVQMATIECGVTGAAGSGTGCKSSAKMFYPALTLVSLVFSVMAL